MNKKLTTHPFMIILYGPTAVGKTDVALSIASKIPSEVINMDVGQFYTPLSIGTAKPPWKKEATSHHLFDIIDDQSDYTVVKYRKAVQSLVKEICSRGNVPIIVGGSAFYLYSLLFPPLDNISHISSVDSFNNSSWDLLYAIDQARAQKIDKNDTYRIERALLLWNQTGKLPVSLSPQYRPFADFLLISVTRDVNELNERIINRIHDMLQQGWIQETQRLIATPWESFIRKKKIIGYNEILDFLLNEQNNITFDYMVESICNKTKQYAKRQRTFWRKIEREIKKQDNYHSTMIGCMESLNLTNTNLQLYIDELLKRL